jgi:hypothetical protein
VTPPTTYQSRIEQIQLTFKKRQFRVEVPSESEFPELIVTVPDSWPHIKLAPLYDVHRGHALHATRLFNRHLKWIEEEKYVISWNGGDLIENVVEGSPGMWSQRGYPGEQFDAATEYLAPIQHKLAFAIPGNHEARTMRVAGFDIAKHLASDLKIPYFADYCFVTFKWRKLSFRGCIHHGTGAAQTAGGQVMAARKDMPWVGCDLYWTGHLHQGKSETVYRADFDQRTGKMFSRIAFVIISPSYLTFFGGYAAQKRLTPGALGLTVATLLPNGNIELTQHAKGKRL